MRVLVVKTSSLGDVVHTLPAVTDAGACLDEVRFDWVVEESFAEIPAWHPLVERVIPVSIRRWRRQPVRTWRSGEWREFSRELRTESYDCVIDAQGLLKSAIVTRRARGPRYGLDSNSAREPLAARFYDHPLAVAKGQHAVERVRQLFAAALGYEVPEGVGSYGLVPESFEAGMELPERYMVFLHGTTWDSKHWPPPFWRELARLCTAAEHDVLLPWGNEAEKQRAEALADNMERARVLPRLPLSRLAGVLAAASGVFAVDTGLAHLAAALDRPLVAFYGPTDPVLTGVYGRRGLAMAADFPCAPCLERECGYRGPKVLDHRLEVVVEPACFSRVSPDLAWDAMEKMLSDGAQP